MSEATEPISSVEEALTNALRAGDFDSARLWAEKLGRQAAVRITSAPDAACRAAIYQKYTSFISDSLHLARVLRAHIGAELSANTGTLLYQDADLEQHRWRFHA